MAEEAAGAAPDAILPEGLAAAALAE